MDLRIYHFKCCKCDLEIEDSDKYKYTIKAEDIQWFGPPLHNIHNFFICPSCGEKYDGFRNATDFTSYIDWRKDTSTFWTRCSSPEGGKNYCRKCWGQIYQIHKKEK